MSPGVVAFPIDAGHRANDLVGWGDYVRGFVDPAVDVFFGAEAPAPNRLFVAADVAYDAGGERLFVADIHNHRFLAFDVSSGSGDPGAIFVLGQPDMFTGGADPAAPFGNTNSPNSTYGCATGVNACGVHRAWAVEYDPVGKRLFGADPDNNRILVWDLSGTVSDGMAASWVLGQTSFTSRATNVSCDGLSSGQVNACGLSRPNDMLVDATGQRLFVSDSGNNRVLVFDLAGGLASGMAATSVIGQSTFSDRAPGTGCDGIGRGITDSCSLSLPTSLAFDEVGQRLFVSDHGAHRVVVYDVGGSFESGAAAVAVLGQPDLVTGTANTACGGGASGEESVNACGLGVFGAMVAYDGQLDRLFVSDVANHRVLAFDVVSIEDGEAAIGVLGQPDYFTGYDAETADWGGGTARGSFNMPQGVVFDEVGDRLFVADGGNHRILTFGANVDGTPLVVGGDTSSSTTTKEQDGSTTVDILAGGSAISVNFPPGSGPLDGAEEIAVTIVQESTGPVVQVDAELPPGETKSITMPVGSMTSVCVDDRAGAAIGAGSMEMEVVVCSADSVALPASGECLTATVGGELGDNPADPADPDGMHSVTVCRSASGSSITVSGLRHSLVGALPARWADAPAASQRDIADVEVTPEAVAEAGCSSAGGATSGLAAALLVLAMGLVPRPLTASRRRRARSRDGVSRPQCAGGRAGARAGAGRAVPARAGRCGTELSGGFRRGRGRR